MIMIITGGEAEPEEEMQGSKDIGDESVETARNARRGIGGKGG